VILLAEDEVMIQNLVRVLLERDGYFVLTAENGEDALLLSREYPFEIHLLLSDVCMPKIDGIQLAQTLKTERPGLCIVLMSGYCEQMNPGFPLLKKPFGRQLLLEAVRGSLAVCR
jgi:YesN/AraC family two-component response regulator